MSKLYAAGNIGTMELKNRWIMLAMHTGFSNEDGSFSERDFAFYKERAKGGAAAITLVAGVNEMACQDRMHRLDGEKYDEGIKEVCRIIHDGDCKVIMQLFHAGRNNNSSIHDGKLPLCPSPVPSPIYRETPKEMTEDEIEQTIKDFALAAKRCKDCGIDCIEVSVSVGYLLTQFLSPLVNQRQDQWGGTPEKRMKFPTEVLKAIRAAVGEDYPVIIKISGGDMLGGYDSQYMIDFINQLPQGTINGVTVTGGWHEAPVPLISYHVKPGGFAYLAEEVKNGTGLTVIACNRINSGEAAAEILDRGIIDFVGAARPFLADPLFAKKVEEGIPYNKCQGCNKGCIERVLRYKDILCAFNPEMGNEYLGEMPKLYENVVVVGAGPVGLEAAYLFAKAGSTVTVITDQDTIGGKIHVADKPPFKADLLEFAENKKYELDKLGVKIICGTPVTAEILEKIKPDYVLFATGAEPIVIKLEGIDSIAHNTAENVLAGQLPPADSRVSVIGGGTVGLETAEFLGAKDNGYDIKVLEMMPKAGKDMGGLKWIMMKSLKKLNVEIRTSVKVTGASSEGLMVETEQGSEKIPCDYVIFAIGARARETVGMADYMDSHGIPYRVIGDGLKSRNIMEGLKDAYEAARGVQQQ